MHLSDITLDDLLHRVLSKLLKVKRHVKASRGGNHEITGVLLHLTNPRARLSRSEGKGTVFSCLGETLWYLAKRNDVEFIKYYVSLYEQDAIDGVIRSGYGPRLFCWDGIDQVANVIDLLQRKPTSRRAVIQLFDAADLHDKTNIEVPCTCTLQFLLREGGLDLIASMRSNDAFRGLPHDVFAFTMLQEIVATALNVKLGSYRHFVGSLHLYDYDVEKAKRYVAEGFQPTLNVAMPAMPKGLQWEWIKVVLQCESAIRERDHHMDVEELALPPFWADIVQLLLAFHAGKSGNGRLITKIKRRMSTPLFNTYLDKRRSNIKVKVKGQMGLPFEGNDRSEAGNGG